MGYIKEPEGVDFVIKSRKLTAKESAEISDFIRADKASRKSVKKTTTSGTQRKLNKHS